MPAALSVSPHPDDEILGGGALLLGLRRAGWRAVVLAATLGRPEQHARRRAELQRACERTGFELRVADPLLRLSAATIPHEEPVLADQIGRMLDELRPALVLSPSPHDGHHAHEAVARAVRGAVERHEQPVTVAWWGLWAQLRLPNVAVDAGPVLDDLTHALAAHAGELERNRYDVLLRARAEVDAVLGAERIFGFGSPALPYRFAELFTATRWEAGEWRFCRPQRLASGEPPAADAAGPAGGWLDAG